ncbi:hypothetical protein B0I33_103230 [Prauserella shujinwangii]|uniref:Uncharacterized protein n=2 Tax=Prauserella shujinwangii TaxID=1453103 RepID=A0A2T0LYK7_9PSEU|nr:hypothetical protein B0I33_103230 [Prauserella shujinwangii]
MAIWDGRRPDSDDEAIEIFGELAERYLENDEVPAAPKITRFVDALVARWGDLDDTGDAPWATGGTGDASGPVLNVNIRYGDDRVDEVSASVAELAEEHGLVCYDLQQERLRP